MKNTNFFEYILFYFLIWTYLFFYFSIYNLNESNKARGRFNGKGFKFILWIIAAAVMIIILYILHKFKLLAYIIIFLSNNSPIIFMYINIIGLSLALIFFTFIYSFLIIENEIKVNLAHIKIKFLRNLIESFINTQPKSLDLNWDGMRKIYFYKIIFILFLLFNLPLFYF